MTTSRRGALALAAAVPIALGAVQVPTMTAAPAATPAAVAAVRMGAGDLLAVSARGGSGRTEVHVLSRASRYRSFGVQLATGLSRTNLAAWSFGVGDYDGRGVPDLFAVNTRDNGGRNTAAHVFSGESNFRQAIEHVRLPRMGAASLKAWQFSVGDYNGDRRADLFAVNTRDNRGRNTAAHVFDGAGRLRRYALQRRLPNMGAASLMAWQFTAGDYTGDGKADLVAVNTRDNRGRNTAAHVFDAGSGMTRYALHRRLPQMGAAPLSVWRFTTADHNGDGRADLVTVNTRDRSGKTAVHALNAANGYRTYLEHAASALHRTSVNTWQFHGWTPPRAPSSIPPNPYPAEEVRYGWTRRMQYVVHHLNVAFDPKGCGGQANGSSSGHVPGSDHYTGNAADCFATRAGGVAAGADKQLGDAMAAWVVRNAGPLKIKYIIWYGRIYDVRQPGWRAYCHRNLTQAQCARPAPGTQATLQHMDHVHISVLH